MKKIIDVNGIKCGSKELFLISGPCVIEDETIMMKTAEKLRLVSENLNIPVIYKSSFMKDNRKVSYERLTHIKKAINDIVDFLKKSKIRQ